MEVPVGFNINLNRIRRGLRLLGVCFLLSMIAVGVVCIFQLTWAWIVVSVGACTVARVGAIHLHRRRISIEKILDNPSLVFWAHTDLPDGHLPRRSLGDYKTLALHLRDGERFEIDLRPGDMADFISWLKRHNSLIHWGPYDSPSVRNVSTSPLY